MKSLIIGGAGFVGEYLAKHLLTLGQEVFVTKIPSQQAVSAEVPVYDLDILQQDQILEVLQKTRPDAVFHLAKAKFRRCFVELPADDSGY